MISNCSTFDGKTVHFSVAIYNYFCSPENTLNYLGTLIQKGAKNTINISNNHFLDNSIRIPNSSDLRAIVDAINTLSSRVEVEATSLKYLKLQRDYLLQHLFV